MKTVLMIRHGRKNGENIDPQALEDIRTHGIPGIAQINRIHRGSDLIRTWETVSAYSEWLTEKAGTIDHGTRPILPSDPRLGSDELFKEMLAAAPGFMEAVKAGMTQFAAIKQLAPREQFQQWSEAAQQALLDIFAQLDDSDVCLSSGHTPMIEMVANVCLLWQLSESITLKELEGFRFEMGNDGMITVWLLKFNLSAIGINDFSEEVLTVRASAFCE
jgi:hypothetical protein